MGKSLKSLKFLRHSIVLGCVLGASLYGIAKPYVINADFEKNLTTDTKNSIVFVVNQYKVEKTIDMVITAYSSTPDQTDDTPFITASGKQVADGIVANNLLPFGTKIRMPDLYGDKVFVVEDRMHKRMGVYHVDIWMSEYSQAKNFGATVTKIEILQS